MENNYDVQLPYSMKLLTQELQAMNIVPRMIINDNIDNPAFMIL